VSKIDAATIEGKSIAVFPTDDVCLTFKEVARKGFTTVTRSEKGPEPPVRRKIRLYYRIKTTAVHSAPVEIRVILPCDFVTSHSRLWRWYPAKKRWEDITKRFSKKYHLIIGETRDCLESVFGVT
jgi:hypothetical protein